MKNLIGISFFQNPDQQNFLRNSEAKNYSKNGKSNPKKRGCRFWQPPSEFYIQLIFIASC